MIQGSKINSIIEIGLVTCLLLLVNVGVISLSVIHLDLKYSQIELKFSTYIVFYYKV